MRRGRLVAAVLLATLSASCALNGLSFELDKRVEIIAPAENSTVALPFEVGWTAREFNGSFALFFDRSPMKPGKKILSLVDEEDPCRRQPACPGEQWLGDNFVYVTDRTSLIVEALADLRPNDRNEDRHQVTIVLLDEAGRRVGESAFNREFTVERGP